MRLTRTPLLLGCIALALALSTVVAAQRLGGGGAGGAMGGPGGGQPFDQARGMLMPPVMQQPAAAPAIAVDAGKVYIVANNTLYKFDAESLALEASVWLDPNAATAAEKPEADYTLDGLRAEPRITIPAGASVVVSLDANASTGFQWQANLADPEIAEVTATRYVTRPTPEGMVGASGFHVMTIEGKTAGETTLELAYARPFEGGEPAEKLTVTVVVE